MEEDEDRAKMAMIPKMGQDFFKYLPSEIIANILLRLPIRSTVTCKCVCKPWLNLLTTPEFIKSHVSSSAPGLAVCQDINEWTLRVYEELGLEQPASPCPTFFMNVSIYRLIRCSFNGLLFLENYRSRTSDLFIFNPITRECIALLRTPLLDHECDDHYGFGVSSITGQYEVVRICIYRCPVTCQSLFQSECQVHTIGTGLWKSTGSAGSFRYVLREIGVFLNGNLHFLVCDSVYSKWISCFDLETESFSTFSAPSLHYHHNILDTLCVLKDCLCICHNGAEDEIVIWSLKDYGDGKSWTREFVISRTISPGDLYGVLTPIKVCENGDVVMAKKGFSKLLCYSDKTKTIRTIVLPGLYDDDKYDRTRAIIFSPSFISLKPFSMETVGGDVV